MQHKMKQQGKELFSWIENGAIVYLSGTKEPMGLDVEKSLLDIIEEFGNKSKDDAKLFLDQLKKEGRYQKEVY